LIAAWAPSQNGLFVGVAVSGGDRYAAAHPERTSALLCRVFDQADGHRQFGLDRPSCRLVPGDQTPGRAVVDLADEHRLHPRLVGLFDLAPDLTVRIAETPERAEAFRVGELEDRAVQHLRLIEIGRAVGGLGAVKSDLEV